MNVCESRSVYFVALSFLINQIVDGRNLKPNLNLNEICGEQGSLMLHIYLWE